MSVYYSLLFMIRFLHNNTSAPMEAGPKTERISVDANLSTTYKSRQQLHLPPLEALNQDTPPPLPAKPQTNNCLNNGHVVQDDLVHEQEKFRPRTSAISSADGKKHRAVSCKSKNGNNTQTVISQPDDQCTASGASNQAPPLPPKPVKSSKLCAKKGASSSSIKSVYQHSTRTHTESLSVLERRMPVQPSQPQERHKTSEKYVCN